MKKKMMVWTLIVLTVMLMASTAFARSYTLRALRTASTSFSIDIVNGSNCAKNRCTSTWVFGAGQVSHKAYLVNSSGVRCSTELNVQPGGGTYYHNPYYNGTFRLQAKNLYPYYGDRELVVDGDYSLHWF